MPSLTPMPVAVSSESPVTILISTPALFNAEIESRMPKINEFYAVMMNLVGIMSKWISTYRFSEDP